MNRRTLLGAAAGLFVVAILVLLYLLSRDMRSNAPAQVAATRERVDDAPRAPAGSAIASSSTVDATVTPMPEGLAQDLAIFNSEQLRAELESIALSYPAVGVVSVSCDAKPCVAELQIGHERDDDELAALNTFLDLASKRFQGYLTASFREVTTPAGEPAIRVVVVIGGDAPRPAPRYGHDQ
jgi:hypothetical protein